MILGYLLTICSLAYILWIYALWISREEREYRDYKIPFTVIIPCYNEGYRELIECVEFTLAAKGQKQVILVNNNSNNKETLKAIKYLSKHKDLLILQQPIQGKRFAHSKGLEYAKYSIVCFVDSDTIVNPNAFVELVKPFQDSNIGAVAGQVKVFNLENYLTNSLSAMFWTSNNIFRKATTSIGMCGVIAGALGAYRKNLLVRLEKDYLSQKFFGRPCSISDDRYITMRIQARFGKEIEYVPSAIGYTYMPTNIKKTWKMIERWRRGVLRETFSMWREPFWNAKLLMFDIQFNFIIISLMVIVKILFLVNLIIHFSLLNLLYTIGWFGLTASLYSSVMLVENIKEFPYKLLWCFLYEFIFIFTFLHALSNIKQQGAWNTR